ncbi:NADPH-dependent FMN reductase [Roseibium sp. RKSG952]|uniref:NADPH-dependent FMN reductase n=1 Tax=Roseibium sp. RKSG952 TaxID=2529384 RepID=UPI0012BBBA77|nr:NAD(P)H-dependent oxidoreductase [Roseibium sp. RKSG952]MTH96469.1 NADPH-dependent oxidoreductase [Roseibium sp. RKSG952]
MSELRLLGISGSLRKGSYNTKLVKEAARCFGPCAFSLGNLRMPLYDGDLEDAEGMPEAAVALYEEITIADAVVISTPEYNKNLPGVLKNALDWVSRKSPMPFDGKPVAILSAAGWTGGARAQFSLRHCLTPFNPHILQGPEVLIAGPAKAFDDEGRLANEQSVAFLTQLMVQLRSAAEHRLSLRTENA